MLPLLTFLLGIVLGAAGVWLWMRGRVAIAEAHADAAESSSARISQSFQAMADAALRSNQTAFLETARDTLATVEAQIAGKLDEKQTAMQGIVQPLNESLARLESQVRELETRRHTMFGALENGLQSLSRETVALANALRSPQARGRWGELTLRRVVELAGMSPYCDFEEQETQTGANGARLRPDMIVRLPGGRTLAVDAKVPLTAYQEAANASDDAARKAALQRHAQQLLRHVEQLGGKQYWSQFQPSPELVILFLPGDHFFSAALEAEANLIERAIAMHVVLSTPSTLIAALAGVAHDWRQQKIAENAEQIRRSAAEMYDRVQTWQNHYADAGVNLKKAVDAYNRSVGSWDSRMLPSLRKVRELGVASGPEPAAPDAIDLVPHCPKPLGAEESAVVFRDHFA
jgi:DNA recombination protein RmuC